MRQRFYELGSHPLWWLLFVVSAVVFATLTSVLESPWSWIAPIPVVLFAVLLYDGRNRWQQDQRVKGESGPRTRRR